MNPAANFTTENAIIINAIDNITLLSTSNFTSPHDGTTTTTTTTSGLATTPAEALPLVVKVLMVAVLTTTAAVGAVGNSVVCVLVYRKAAMRSAVNLLVAQLALSDLLLCLLVMPSCGLGLFLASRHWASELCGLEALVQRALVTLNACLLLAVSLDRYLIIVHRQERLNVRRARAVIVLAWLFSLLTALPPLLGWGQYPVYPGHPQCLAVPEGASPADLSYVALGVLLTRYAPTAAILYCYARIVGTVRRKSMKVHHYCMDVGLTHGGAGHPPRPQPRISITGALREFSSPVQYPPLAPSPLSGAFRDVLSSPDYVSARGRACNGALREVTSAEQLSVTSPSSVTGDLTARSCPERFTFTAGSVAELADVSSQHISTASSVTEALSSQTTTITTESSVTEASKPITTANSVKEASKPTPITTASSVIEASKPITTASSVTETLSSQPTSITANSPQPPPITTASDLNCVSQVVRSSSDQLSNSTKAHSSSSDQLSNSTKALSSSSDQLSNSTKALSSSCNAGSLLSSPPNCVSSNSMLMTCSAGSASTANHISGIVSNNFSGIVSPGSVSTHNNFSGIVSPKHVSTANHFSATTSLCSTCGKMRGFPQAQNSVSASMQAQEYRDRLSDASHSPVCFVSANSSVYFSSPCHKQLLHNLRSSGFPVPVFPVTHSAHGPGSPTKQAVSKMPSVSPEIARRGESSCMLTNVLKVPSGISSSGDCISTLLVQNRLISGTGSAVGAGFGRQTLTEDKQLDDSTAHSQSPPRVQFSLNSEDHSTAVDAVSLRVCPREAEPRDSTSIPHRTDSASLVERNTAEGSLKLYTSHSLPSLNHSHTAKLYKSEMASAELTLDALRSRPSYVLSKTLDPSCKQTWELVDSRAEADSQDVPSSKEQDRTSSPLCSCFSSLGIFPPHPASRVLDRQDHSTAYATHSLPSEFCSCPGLEERGENTHGRLPVGLYSHSHTNASFNATPELHEYKISPSFFTPTKNRARISHHHHHNHHNHHHHQHPNRTPSYLSSPSGFSPTGAKSARRTAGARRQVVQDMTLKTRAFKTILILSLLLCVCWMPHATAVLVTSLAGRPSPMALGLLLWLGLVKSALNPVVYCLRIRKFRDVCRDSLPRSCHSCCPLPRCAALVAKRRVNPSSVYQCAETSMST